MPFLDLQTNLPASSFNEDFLKKFTSVTAAALGKPEDRMNVVVHPALPMLIGGSCSPCVVLSVSAIGVTDTADKNKEHSSKMFSFLSGALGLSEDRVVIQFHALQPHQVGKNGTVMSFLWTTARDDQLWRFQISSKVDKAWMTESAGRQKGDLNSFSFTQAAVFSYFCTKSLFSTMKDWNHFQTHELLH